MNGRIDVTVLVGLKTINILIKCKNKRQAIRLFLVRQDGNSIAEILRGFKLYHISVLIYFKRWMDLSLHDV